MWFRNAGRNFGRNAGRGFSPAGPAGPKGPAYVKRAIGGCEISVVGGLQPAVRWIAGSGIWLFAGAALSACPICFQVEDAGVRTGVRAAVVVLGGITSAVLAGFAVFARRLVRAEQKQ